MSEKTQKKAVALKYPPDAPAPFITVTAQGHLADELLKCAKMNDIIIVENKGLTDFLCVQEAGSLVPEEAWEVVAQIFAFIEKSQK